MSVLGMNPLPPPSLSRPMNEDRSLLNYYYNQKTNQDSNVQCFDIYVRERERGRGLKSEGERMERMIELGIKYTSFFPLSFFLLESESR